MPRGVKNNSAKERDSPGTKLKSRGKITKAVKCKLYEAESAHPQQPSPLASLVNKTKKLDKKSNENESRKIILRRKELRKQDKNNNATVCIDQSEQVNSQSSQEICDRSMDGTKSGDEIFEDDEGLRLTVEAEEEEFLDEVNEDEESEHDSEGEMSQEQGESSDSDFSMQDSVVGFKRKIAL